MILDLQRRRIWPLLLDVDPDFEEKVPSLEELSDHPEYSQVVLDVNRSLKRFPPGIPYKQRLALQDQLTVLILRVIMKYPHLRYYQVGFFYIRSIELYITIIILGLSRCSHYFLTSRWRSSRISNYGSIKYGTSQGMYGTDHGENVVSA